MPTVDKDLWVEGPRWILTVAEIKKWLYDYNLELVYIASHGLLRRTHFLKIRGEEKNVVDFIRSLQTTVTNWNAYH